MANLVQLTPTKTYATVANAIKAVEKKYPSSVFADNPCMRYMVMTHSDGRFFPVFIGVGAMQWGVHFSFNIVA